MRFPHMRTSKLFNKKCLDKSNYFISFIWLFLNNNSKSFNKTSIEKSSDSIFLIKLYIKW